ncbi:MAG: hypothetical protein ACPGO3_10570 [Magnetospiraceae bacterium]
MRAGFVISLGLHVAIIVIAYLGLPHMRTRDFVTDAPVVVDLIDIAETTNVPTAPEKTPDEPPRETPTPPKKPEPDPPKPDPVPEPPKEPEPEPEPAPPPEPDPVPVPKPEPEPEPIPEPEPAPAPEPDPVPAPEPEPEPEPTPPPPQPEPEPAPTPEPTPEPDPAPEPERVQTPEQDPGPKPPDALAKAAPKKKPKPPDDWTTVLKTVERIESRPRPRPQTPEPKPNEDFTSTITQALSTKPAAYDPSKSMTASELDALRSQLARCWSPPIGSVDAQNLVIEVRLRVNPNRTVASAEIVDKARMRSDPFFRVAAESAVRAFGDRRCTTLQLPPQKYDFWKTMIVEFDPREMFGR